MSECFVGEIRIFAGNYSPLNWVLCNGQQLGIAQYEVLFSLIGTSYGGDGVTSFNVPDLRGRLPVGQGAAPGLSNRVIAQAFGAETHTLTTAEMAAHAHPVTVKTSNATSVTVGPTMLYAAVQPGTVLKGLYTTFPPEEAPPVQLDPKAVSSAGGSLPHQNMMMSTGVNFIMATTGIYPSRP